MLLRSRAAIWRPVVVLRAVATVTVGAALVSTTHAGAASTPTAAAKVTLKNIAFKRAVVTIKVGQRVTWTWQDGQFVSHNIHSVGKPRFAGAPAKTKGTHTVRFTKKGNYRYTCTLHPGMDGRVVVK
ncbi:hypothetical protein DSM112329_01860 [Paraconexibacter sp. AEG42_29]|uniref:Blue (type 1) copper domain-containing protein n=1 Tax=Paraconexibacter sp. AEG42_29 TaxID=2997339 RepID=A0AAU7AUJ7_9ACTN